MIGTCGRQGYGRFLAVVALQDWRLVWSRIDRHMCLIGTLVSDTVSIWNAEAGACVAGTGAPYARDAGVVSGHFEERSDGVLRGTVRKGA